MLIGPPPNTQRLAGLPCFSELKAPSSSCDLSLRYVHFLLALCVTQACHAELAHLRQNLSATADQKMDQTLLDNFTFPSLSHIFPLRQPEAIDYLQ